MKLIFLVAFTVFVSIYTLHFNDIDGNDTSFSSYQNKKILIVNIATNSPRAGQLAQLQQLYQQYHDSLVIIAFPSNSFNNETRTNSQIKSFCNSNYNTTFVIAEKGDVKGSSVQPVYNWLSHSSDNGNINAVVVGDFQKFLINNSGTVIAEFAPSVLPTDSSIINAIINN